MNDNFKYLSACNLCERSNLKHVLHLCRTPLANSFLKEQVEQDTYPLDLLECQDCGHVQLSVVVNPDLLFKDYLYVSGTSKVFVKHFEDYATSVIKELNLQKTDLVCDIGSNDGTLLSFFKNYGCRIIGVDPAENLAKQANEAGIPTIPAFFNESVAAEILNKNGKAKLILANNVFAHSNELKQMLDGVKILLDYDGQFVFEVSYLPDLINGLYFDNLYHEHISFHHLAPLINFLETNGMTVMNAIKVNTHGGSIRVSAQKQSTIFYGTYYRDNIKALLQEEAELGLLSTTNIFRQFKLNKNFVSPFVEFAEKIKNVKEKLRARLSELKTKGCRIVGYGAPAKSTTLLHYLDIAEFIDYVVDDSNLKTYRYTPNTNLFIYPTEQIYETGISYDKDKDADVILILAWNFAESIMKNNEKFRSLGGKFIVPLPEIKEIG